MQGRTRTIELYRRALPVAPLLFSWFRYSARTRATRIRVPVAEHFEKLAVLVKTRLVRLAGQQAD